MGTQHPPEEPPSPATGPGSGSPAGPTRPVELDEDTVAVRPRAGAEETASQKLAELGQVQPLGARRVLVLRLPEGADRQAALDQLEEWRRQGLIEFATPVLRHSETQLPQILTDEITVRLKPDSPQEHLREMEQKYGVVVARQSEFAPNQFILKVSQPTGLRTLEVANEINAEDAVEFAEPNYIAQFRR